MKQQNRLFVGLFTILLFAMGCDRRTPSNVLSKKEMTKVLADYHLARSMISNLSHDERYQAPLILEGVFEKHGTTQAIFDSSMVWYTRNPDDLTVIYSRVNNLLQERLTAEGGQRGVEFGGKRQLLTYTDPYSSGDSIDLWRSMAYLEMNRFHASRKEQFIINPDTTFQPTDLIEWELNAHFLPQSGKGGKALMFLMIRYASDSVIISSRILDKNGKYSLTVRNNSGLEMRQIWGFLQYFPGQGQDWQNRLLVDRIQLMRYRKRGETEKKDPHTSEQPLEEITDSITRMEPELNDSIQGAGDSLTQRRGTVLPERNNSEPNPNGILNTVEKSGGILSGNTMVK